METNVQKTKEKGGEKHSLVFFAKITASIVRGMDDVSQTPLYIFYQAYRKRGIMCTESESRLRKFVTIPEMDIPLSLLLDLISFACDRQREIKEQADILKSALDSEYIDLQRKPIDIKNGLQSSINDASFELGHWYALHTRLNNISHDILNNQ